MYIGAFQIALYDPALLHFRIRILIDGTATGISHCKEGVSHSVKTARIAELESSDLSADGNRGVGLIGITNLAVLRNGQSACNISSWQCDGTCLGIQYRQTVSIGQCHPAVTRKCPCKITVSRIVCIAILAAYREESIALNRKSRITVRIQQASLRKNGVNGRSADTKSHLGTGRLRITVRRSGHRLQILVQQ